MSIYATLWRLQFPRYGEDYIGCEWTEVTAQGVPAHIGTPTPGEGYEDGNPYADFLPPAVPLPAEYDGTALRAVVFVRAETTKGTERSGQEYVNPLLVVTGEEYARLSFGDLHEQLCEALRAGRPRRAAQMLGSDGSSRLVFEDGTVQDLDAQSPADQGKGHVGSNRE